jgi:hypothetical protein
MMSLIALILFTTALGAIVGVLALTLWPALPHMASLLAGGTDGRVAAPVERRVMRRVSRAPVDVRRMEYRVAA